MQTVGIKDLKNRLSAYLLLPKAGKSLLVTERGKPVAVIRPVEQKDIENEESMEEKLGRLAKTGLIKLPSLKKMNPFKPVKINGSPVSLAIIEDRR